MADGPWDDFKPAAPAGEPDGPWKAYKPKAPKASGGVVDTLSDLYQVGVGGLKSGFGSLVQGVAQRLDSQRLLDVGQSISNAGAAQRADLSEAGKAADQGGLAPSGEPLHPSTWTLGPAPVRAVAQNVLGGVAQMAPIIAGTALTRNPRIAMGVGAGIGALQAAGEAGQAESERIAQAKPEDLAAMPGYQERLAAGLTPAQARADLARSAGSSAARAAAPVGATYALPMGKKAQGVLRGIVGESRLARAAAGAVLEPPILGAQNVASSAAQVAGANAATGEQRSPTEGAGRIFTEGASTGIAIGLGAGLLRALKRPAPQPGSEENLRASEDAAVEQANAPQKLHATMVNPDAGPLSNAYATGIATERGEPVKPVVVVGAHPDTLPKPNPDTGEIQHEQAPEASSTPATTEQVLEAVRKRAPEAMDFQGMEDIARELNVPIEAVVRARRQDRTERRNQTGPYAPTTKENENGQVPEAAAAAGGGSDAATDRNAGSAGGDAAAAAGSDAARAAAGSEQAGTTATDAAAGAAARGPLEGAAGLEGKPLESQGRGNDEGLLTPRAGVPMMITQAMRKGLRDLGHSDGDINKMTPQAAWDALQAATSPNGSTHSGERVEPSQPTPVEKAAEQAATSPKNDLPAPTPAQVEAGNFQMGHHQIGDLDISIEHPAGVLRKPEHTVPTAQAYGYLKGTHGADGEHVDAFLGPHADDLSKPVFVVDQQKAAGGHDEHKTMLGFDTADEARAAYLANYPKGWKAGPVTEFTHEQFSKWVHDPKQTAKPAAEAVGSGFATSSDVGKPEQEIFHDNQRAAPGNVQPVPVQGGEAAPGQRPAETHGESGNAAGKAARSSFTRSKDGILRYKFGAKDGMDGQVTVTPPGWIKGQKSYEVALDRVGGPKDARGVPVNFFPTVTIGKFRSEQAARAAAEKAVLEHSAQKPAGSGSATSSNVAKKEPPKQTAKPAAQAEGITADRVTTPTPKEKGNDPFARAQTAIASQESTPQSSASPAAGSQIVRARRSPLRTEGALDERQARRTGGNNSASTSTSAPAMWRRGKSAEAVLTAKGEWYTRHKVAGQWQPWKKVKTFDPSGAFGYKPHVPERGGVMIPGVGRIALGERTLEANQAAKGPKPAQDLLGYIASLGGLNREEFQHHRVDPAEFKRMVGVGKWVFAKNGGLSMDKLREHLEQDGFLPPEKDSEQRQNVDTDALDLVMRALSGEKVFPTYADNFEAQNEAISKNAEHAQENYERNAAEAEESFQRIERAGITIPAGMELDAQEIAYRVNKLLDAGMAPDDVEIELQWMEGRDPFAMRMTFARLLEGLEKKREAVHETELEYANAPPAGEAGDQGTSAWQAAVPKPFELTPFEQRAAAARTGRTDRSLSGQGDLLAPATTAEKVAAAERDKEAKRNGKTGKVIPSEHGLPLFAGKVPEQVKIEDSKEVSSYGHTSPLQDRAERGGVASPGSDAAGRRAHGVPAGQLDLFIATRKNAEPAQGHPPAVLVNRSKLAQRTKLVQTGQFRSGITKVETLADAAHIMAPLRKSPQEQFLALALDNDGRPLAVLRHSIGQIDGSDVGPGVVVGALTSIPGIKSVVFGHNHPSGAMEASSADLNLDERLRDLLDGTGIEAKGAIIVGPGSKTAAIYGDKQGLRSRQEPVTVARRDKIAVPQVERTLHKVMPKGDRIALTEPSRAAAYVQKIAHNDPQGIVLLNNRHEVMGVLPMTGGEMGKLRTYNPQTGIGKLLRGLEEGNAAAVIVYGHPRNAEALRNVGAAIKKTGIRVLDIFHADGNGEVKSMAAAGRDSVPAGFMSKPEPGDVEETEKPAFKRWFGASKVVDADGKPLAVYHGTQRPDRIGDRFQAKRASSGPMAYFTDNPDIASKYATGKQDTSIDVPEDYSGWFKFKPKGARSEVDLDRAWHFLTPEERTKIAATLPHVIDEEGEPLRKGGDDEYGLSSKDHWDYNIRRARGNVLEAAKEIWLSSGHLFNDEDRFMDVLRLGGMPMERTRFDSPHASYPGVYKVWLRISHPLDTANAASLLGDLQKKASRQRAAAVAGNDMWAKSSVTAHDWMERLRDDIKNGTTHAWTSIPDWVTQVLKDKGYDGIKDVGGKNGGVGHTVWVPFDDSQVKSATGNRGTYDPNNPRLSMSKPEPSSPGGLMLDRDALDKHIARITRTWKGDSPIVRVVATAKDLPAQAQRGDGWQKAEGYYDGQSKVYLVASNLRNVTRAEHVLAHEAFGHYGIEGIVGKDEWGHIIAQVAKLRASESLSGDMAAAMASTERRYGNESASVFAREFLAVAAERGVKSTLIGRVLAAVRRWVGKLGINVGDWSEADLRDLVSRGRAAVQDREPVAGQRAARAGAFAEKSPTFYSALKESLDRAKGAPKAADAATWKGWLDGAQRRGEFKGGERQWLGLDDWLDRQKGNVTRQQVQEFVRSNQVDVRPVKYGDSYSVEQLAHRKKVFEEYADRMEDANKRALDYNGTDESRRRGREDYDRLIDERDAKAMEGMEETAGEPKFAAHTLPGGENYREHLLTLPQAAASVAAKRREIFAKWQVDIDAEEQAAQQAMNRFGSDSGRFAAYRNRVENLRNARDREIERAGVESSDLFRSGHFNEPNILAHVRMNDRTTADGKKALHIEEIQSDWHQRGRRSGYRGDDQPDAETHKLLDENGYEAKHNGVNWVVTAKDGGDVPNKLAGGSAKYQFAGNLQQVAQMVLGRRDLMAGHDAVPQAPLKRTEDWALLGFKHALREAVETGKDKVTWTTGDQQAARYDLSKQVDGIQYRKNSDGKNFELRVFKKGSNDSTLIGRSIAPEKLEDYVGKDIAKKIIDGEGVEAPHTGHKLLSGLDLKVGGEGMRAFYDKMLPDAVNKYVKQWGGKASLEPERIREFLPDRSSIKKYAGLSLDPMDQGMGAAVENDKVAKAVVGRLPVDVMNLLSANGIRPEDVVRKPSMLADKLSVDQRVLVSDGLRNALSETAAHLRAGLDSAYKAGLDKEILPALRASDLGLDVAAGIRFPELFDVGRSSRGADAGMGTSGARPGAEARSGTVAFGRGEFAPAGFTDFQNWHNRIAHGGSDLTMPEHWEVSITPAMREAVAEGQPLFSRPDKTDTPEFRKWFGESKVVDRAGNPLVVYHGAPDARFMGQDATFKSVHERYGKLGGKRAFWFSDHTTARSYADDRRAFDYQNAEPAVIPAFLKIENPLIVDAGGKDWREAQARGKTSNVIEQAQEGGHDGVIIRNVRDNYNNGPKTKPADTYVVFDSRQIKSATRNSGAFDANNPSILFSRPDTGTADGHDLGDEAPAAEWPRGRNDARRAAQDIKARAKAMTALSRGILQENWATKERNIATADAAVDKFRTAQDKSIGMLRKQGLTGKQLAEAAYADITAHQRGERVTNAATQQFLDLHDKLLADQVARLREADPDGKYLQNLRENYFHQSWKDPKKAAEVFAQLMARRPLTGDKGFTKQRFYQDYQAGIDAGLEPSSLNYVDPFMARYQSGEKLITGLQIKNMLTDKGWVRPIENDRLEQGYARVNDGTFNGVQVPDFVARDLNNYLAPGLSQYQKWRSFRWLQNVLLSTRLGFSLFHAGMTTIDSFVSSASLAVRQALRGNMTAALENMADAAKAIPHTLQAFADRGKGAQLVKQFLGQTASDANTAAVLKFLEAGGARARQHAGIEYNDAWTQAKRAFDRRDPLTDPNNTRGENAQQVAKRLGTMAAAAVEASTRLIQHRLVPAQKMLARYMLAKFELDKAIDKLGLAKGDYAGAVAAMRPDAARQIASRINADVDDRLGQLVYDNLHWNRIVKDALQGAVQSVGWNFGSLRLLLGGIKDIGNIAKPEAITGPLDKAGRVEHYQTGRLTNRLAYLVALNASVALMGAVTQKLLTDEWPTEGKDFFFPKTGRTSSNGSAERVSFPTYVKDEYAYAHHPIETLQHKLHPALSMMSEVMQNRDYYGDRIYDPDGSVPADARDLLTYMAKGFMPYAVQGAVKNKQAEDADGQDHAGKDAALAAAPFIGITPAPADLSHTPFEQYVQDKYVDTLPQGAKTPEDQAKIDARKEALRAMRSGEEADTSMFSPAQVRAMKREASTPVFQTRFSRLTLPQKLRAYDLASPAERERFGLDRMIARHLAKNVQALPEDERDTVLAKAEAILSQRGEPPPDDDEP